MLGDGCLYRDKPTHNPYLSICRQVLDRGYLEWQFTVFQNLTKHPIYDYTVHDVRTNKDYDGVKLATRRCTSFVVPYERWYPSGEKRVPNDLRLTPLTIAVWFADDGCITRPAPKYPNLLSIKMSTHGFPEEDTRRLALNLSNRYQANFRVNQDNGNYYIAAATIGALALIKEIDEHLPPGIDRKRKWYHV